MKVLIIDDEANVRRTLLGLLKTFCEGIDEIEEAYNVTTALQKLEIFKPDLVFADVELEDKTAFEIFNQLNEFNFQLIFTTAYQKYAIDAFRFSAIDFLLKPVDPILLSRSVAKAQENLNKENLKEQLLVLQTELRDRSLHTGGKLVLKDKDAIYFVKICSIMYCQADGAYSTFYIDNQEKIIISKTLKEYEDLLLPYGFIRTHQSFLVNKTFVKKFEKQTDFIILDNNQEIPVSQRKRDAVLTNLKG